MKTFQLLAGALLLASAASAQRYTGNALNGEYSPTVYLISAYEVEPAPDCTDRAHEAARLNRQAVDNATQDFADTYRPGFQQVEKPQFVFTSKNNRFSFALGGTISMRVGYDFEGISDNIDFVPYDIAVPGNYDTKQKLMMDASTSRFFLKAITNTRNLGRVVAFIDTDFRGGATNSYTPHLRSAYVSFLGFTFGRDVTTFCDLQAAPTTIDYRGPNAYNLNYNTMVRYEIDFARDHMTFGIAAEMPHVSATYNDYYAPLRQRVPDVPAYLQFAWGPERNSHLRASAVVRNMYLHHTATGNNTSLLGWGVQLSGRIKVARPLVLYANGIYGKGITPYIQDLTGSGLDFAPNPENVEQIQTTPMWAWQAAAQINLSRRLFVSGGYSTVRVQENNGYIAPEQYKQGQYVFGNIFYALTSRCKLAAEYLYGTRKNMNHDQNHANRVNVMVQYNF